MAKRGTPYGGLISGGDALTRGNIVAPRGHIFRMEENAVQKDNLTPVEIVS